MLTSILKTVRMCCMLEKLDFNAKVEIDSDLERKITNLDKPLVRTIQRT